MKTIQQLTREWQRAEAHAALIKHQLNKAIEQQPKTIKIHGLVFEIGTKGDRKGKPIDRPIDKNWVIIPRPKEKDNAIGFRSHDRNGRIGVIKLLTALGVI